MTFLNRKVFKLSFTILCAIVVAFMVGYWFYKYEYEDRDIGVVDYAMLEHEKDIKSPVTSLCFESPFIGNYSENYTVKIRGNVTEISYRDYLAGDLFDNTHQRIDYTNVTLDLNQYFRAGTIWWQNGTSNKYFIDSISRIEKFNYFNYGVVEPYLDYVDDMDWEKLNETYEEDNVGSINFNETFNGFNTINSLLMKCFTMQVGSEEPRNVKSISLNFDNARLLEDWQSSYRVSSYFVVHYPNQLFLTKEVEMQYFGIWDDLLTVLSVEKLEILKQRNSRNRKCSKDIDNYDNIIIDELLHKTGCRPPYLHTHESFPECDTQNKIRVSKIDFQTGKRLGIPKACKRISEVRLSLKGLALENSWNLWTIKINYPEEVKIITQSRDVDVHSLIGNIGGYLGLFLGKPIFYSSCDLMMLQ